jgi:hypothetical protein
MVFIKLDFVIESSSKDTPSLGLSKPLASNKRLGVVEQTDLSMLSNSFWDGFLVGAFLIFTGYFVFFVSNRTARARTQRREGHP